MQKDMKKKNDSLVALLGAVLCVCACLVGCDILTIREALTNAVKHAGADKLTISVSENNGRYDVEIRNNGRAVNPPIQEGGGLSSLRKRLEQDGATMSYRYNGAVTLVLTIPKE